MHELARNRATGSRAQGKLFSSILQLTFVHLLLHLTSNVSHQTSKLACKERVVLFLLAHCGHGAMPGANDCFVRQRENFLEIVL